MNETITHFLQEQTCATICYNNETGNACCFSCYYAINSKKGLLYFKSSPGVYHSLSLRRNPMISGTVLPDKLNMMATKGVQFQGEVLEHFHPLAKNASIKYHKSFPLALTINGEVFTVQLNNIKMTDSTLGFGKKITWDRNEFIA